MNPRVLIGGIAVFASVIAMPAAAQAAPLGRAVTPSVPSITEVSRAGSGAALVTVDPGSGGSPATSFRVTASPSGKGCTITVPATQCKVAGLSNGTSYTFTATASGAGGKSAESAASAALVVGTIPSKPIQVKATADIGGVATLTWSAGASDGGLPISGFEVTGSGGQNCTTAADVTSCQFTGLVPGSKYFWTVVARNEVGTSLVAQSNTITAKPGLPSVPSVTEVGRAGSGAALVTVAAAAEGFEATSFRVTASPSGKGCTIKVPATQCKVAGLSNGTSYTFTATASGAGGKSAESAASAALVVGTIPSKPIQVKATADIGGVATLTWSAGASDGGLPISGFEVTGSGGQNCTTAADVTSCQFTGLVPGSKYFWTVVARNEVGTSLVAQSNNMTAIGAKRPGSPTVTAMERAGDGKVRVTAVPGAENGAPVTRIVVRTDALRADGTWSRMATVWCAITLPGDSCVITGLTNGNYYRFVAEATNIVGTSPLSSPTDPFQAGL